MTDCLETVRYGSDDPAAPDNFEEYFTFTNLFRFRRIDERPFHARGSFWMLGDLAVTEHRMGGVHARRGAAELLVAPADHVTVMVLFDGRLDHVADRATTARAGDVLLVDYSRAFDYRTPGHAGATISLPRALIEDRLGPIVRHGVLPDTAEMRLLGGYIRTLVQQLPQLAADSIVPVAAITRRLVVTALGSVDAGSRRSAPGSARARAQAWLDAQPPGTVDIARMATALGVSRSGLYRLFAREGGVVAHDRRRRLRLLHMALLEAPRGASLGDLGAQFGFLDMSTLARQFRAQFGHSMSEVRRHLPVEPGDAAVDAPPLERYRRAFEGLSCIAT